MMRVCSKGETGSRPRVSGRIRVGGDRSNVRAVILASLVTAVVSTSAFAVEPGERLADPVLEARARALSADLRCLVCQNQSIDDSNAPLAKDLRVLLREQIQAGKSDSDVMSYVVARYGDFVLLRPRFTASTALLWLTPLLILGAVGFGFWRRREAAASRADTAPLTADEQRRLDAILRSKS